MSNPQSNGLSSPSAVPTTWPQRNIFLHGTYITLTPLESQHTETLWPVVSAPETVNAPFWPYLHVGPWTQYEDFASIVQSRISCQDGVFYAIIDNESRQPHGWIGLRHIDVQTGKGEIGIFVPSPLAQKRAVSTEAVFLYLMYAFDSLGFKRVGWLTDSRHAESRRAAERLGFKLEMVSSDDERFAPLEMAHYGVVLSDWLIVRKAMDMWLDPHNIDENGVQRVPLSLLRKGIEDAANFTQRGIIPPEILRAVGIS